MATATLLEAAVVVVITVALEMVAYYAARYHMGPAFERWSVWWREVIGVFLLLSPATVWVMVASVSAEQIVAVLWANAVVVGSALRLVESFRLEKALQGEERINDVQRTRSAR